MGEATETALVVLAEKMNPFGYTKSGLSRRDAAVVVNQGISGVWKKEFTLDFSRDRKSMSTYCIPLKTNPLGVGPKMFCKVCISFKIIIDIVCFCHSSVAIYSSITYN